MMLKKSMIQNVDNRFYNDMQGKYNSFFNHLLADTYNAPFHLGSRHRPKHDTLVRHPFVAPNAADTVEQWQEKWDTVKDRLVGPRFRMQNQAPRDEDNELNLDKPFPTNVFPKTIGLWMREQLLQQAEDLEFKTDTTLESAYDESNVTRLYTRRRWNMIEKPVTYTRVELAQSNPELELRFRDNNNGRGNGWNYGFNLKLINYLTDERGNQLTDNGYRVVLEELETTNIPDKKSFAARFGPAIELPATTRVSKDIRFDVNVPMTLGVSSNILDIYKSAATAYELERYNISGVVFKNYVKNVYSKFGITADLSDDLLAKDLFDTMNNFVYKSVLDFALDDPNGSSFTLSGYRTLDKDGEEVEVSPTDYSGVPEAFMFGYVNDNLTKADLTYVGPDANPSDEDTWEYDYKNKEKVLGKSATENPRVEFLDPELHDMGKYTRPKIYVSPPKYTGWLAVNQIIIPEEDNHEPKRKGFLFIDDLIKKEKDLREEIPMDERITDPLKCSQEGPYDVFSDPTGHAGTHVSVVSMARVFAFEHILRSMSIYQIVKPDFTNNFDDSVLAAIVEDMEEELKDMPKGRSKRGFFRGYRFWLLFLEQSAQTVERMIITGDIDPNPAITAALEDIQKVRDEYTPLTRKWIRLIKHVRTIRWDGEGAIAEIDFAYSRKIKGKRKYYPMNMDMSNEDMEILKSYIDGVMFYSLGRNFRSILANEERNFAFRMRRRQKRLFKMAYKVHAIHKSRDTAKILLRYIVADQLNYYGEKLREIGSDVERAGPKPKYFIDDVKKYFFGSSNTILSPFSGGSFEEEEAHRQAVKEAEEAGEDPPSFEYDAEVKHVIHDQFKDNPIDHFSVQQLRKLSESVSGNFYFEKYLRIVDKPTGHSSETKWFADNQKTIVDSRDERLKGVVNIKEFQNFMKENQVALSGLSQDTKIVEDGTVEPYYWNTKVSNIFGDATPVFEERTEEDGAEDERLPPEVIGYDGSVGIKFGVRLCYIPPASFDPGINPTEARLQKSFAFRAPESDLPELNGRKIFPLVSYERDIIDKEVGSLNLEDDNFGEDLSCYIEELMKSAEMDLIFGYCAPVKRATSLMALYSHYAFIPSVAEHPQERDNENGDGPSEVWKSVILSQTKNSLRHLFISNYSSVIFLSEKAGSQRDGFKINFPLLWRKLFMFLINPFAFFNLSWGGFGSWRTWSRFVDRPYDMYGEVEGADDGVE